MEGLAGQIRNPLQDISVLEEVPEKKGWMGWILPIAVLSLVLGGFFFKPPAGLRDGQVVDHLQRHLSGLGAIAALAHPLTILAAVSAPITTLNPALAAGWFAGLSEAYIKKPKVSDFESIHEDIMKAKGWWTNPITRILLVVVLVNLKRFGGCHRGHAHPHADRPQRRVGTFWNWYCLSRDSKSIVGT